MDNESMHGALRKCHQYVPTHVNFYSECGKRIKTMRFSDTVGNTALIEPNYYSALRGMLFDPIATKCIAYTEEIRSRFAKNKCGIGIDLMSLDVMRGRDVGIVPYIKCFNKCVGIKIRCWKDLKPFISEEYWPVLQKIYPNVNDIDMIVGILAEKRTHGNFGPIGACILVEQFRRMKFGNQFYYTFKESRNPFTDGKRH